MKLNSIHTCTVSLILESNGKILLLKRPRKKGGNYSLVGGRVEPTESVTHALIREAYEEAGIILQHEDLRMVHAMHRQKNDESIIHFFFHATRWSGTILNKEPEKCDRLEWFEMNELPVNTTSAVMLAVILFQQGITYSEFNWKYPENVWSSAPPAKGLK
ncbi:NUDIX domain-containing protein [Sphingobacteriales bacterium UPWRP_1]|nr:hypothetical protein B6N25_04175 [Sphingobacteriales bacterium TSM_CSS]PSJ73938.1 NUDIX domain-containing protein [Sphingobacteriales bacterium UPWRP_1]